MRAIIGIQIHPRDNVVTLVDAAFPAAVVEYATAAGRQQVTAADEIPFGHKVAVDDIPAGESVVKYDEVIGRASRAIRRGQHVHDHNVESAVQGGAK
jgi:altronate dehydratase small subunit